MTHILNDFFPMKSKIKPSKKEVKPGFSARYSFLGSGIS